MPPEFDREDEAILDAIWDQEGRDNPPPGPVEPGPRDRPPLAPSPPPSGPRAPYIPPSRR